MRNARIPRVSSAHTLEALACTSQLALALVAISRTHRNLEEMVKAGEFREDLYYRLNVVPVWMPPLRERPGNIAKLAQHFCSSLATGNRKTSLTPEALDLLSRERWPGNVRQLQNFIERLLVFADGPAIGISM
jgi:two-component system response regulator AtoC